MATLLHRGAATGGRVARAVAGTTMVEIKATIPHRQIRTALSYCRLSDPNEEERYVYFFDTPTLALLRSGVIARARRNVGGVHDSTVKIRPVLPEHVPNRWTKVAGFKIEADANENQVVRSASLTLPVVKGLIKKVAAGEEKIGTLFTKEQVRFLEDIAPRRIDLSKAVVMGPLRSWRWKFQTEAMPWPLTAELWRRADGQSILEISIKTVAVQTAVAGAGFFAHLGELGAERDNAQQAKTRWALEYFATK
jgi:hypothetical protein